MQSQKKLDKMKEIMTGKEVRSCYTPYVPTIRWYVPTVGSTFIHTNENLFCRLQWSLHLIYKLSNQEAQIAPWGIITMMTLRKWKDTTIDGMWGTASTGKVLSILCCWHLHCLTIVRSMHLMVRSTLQVPGRRLQ